MTNPDPPRCQASGCEKLARWKDEVTGEPHPFCSVSCWISDQALSYTPMTAPHPLLPDPAQAMLDVTDPQLAAQARAIYGILERAGFRALCVSSKGTVTLPEAVETLVVARGELREQVEHYEKLARKYLKQRDELGARLGVLLPTNAKDEATVDAMLARHGSLPPTAKES